MLPAYDKVLKEFFSLKLNGKPVPIVGPVNPLRAFASMRTLMEKQGQKITDDRFVPLPFISIYRMPPSQNLNRFRRADLRKLRYSDDMNIVEQSRMPFPYDIPYQIDIWCRYEDDLVTLIEGCMRKWRGPVTYVDVDHGNPHGKYKVGVFFEGAMDNSELESDDRDRDLRYTINLNVEGFLSFPSRRVKTVRHEKIVAGFNEEPDAASDVLLAEHKE
jgi:hypothetical protein